MKLKNIAAYFVLHAKAYIRTRSGVFFQILFPVILIIMFGFLFGSSSVTPQNLIIVNHDNGQFSTQFITALSETGTFKIKVENISNIRQFLDQNPNYMIMVIPSNFTANILNKSKVTIQVYSNSNPQVSSEYAGIINTVFQAYINSFNGKGLSSSLQVYDYSGVSSRTINYYIPGLIGFTIISSMFSMLYQVPNYRREKIFRQFKIAGLSKSEWIIGSSLFNLTFNLIADALIIIIAYILFGAVLYYNPLNVLMMLIIIVSGNLMFIALGALAGMVSDNEETVSIVGNLILFPMMFLSGVFFPLQFAPGYVKIISDFLPLTYFINALNYVLIYNNIEGSLYMIAILAVSSIALFALSSKLLKFES
mgnify:CR=1 FL=1